MKSKKILSVILTFMLLFSICGVSTVEAATVSGSFSGGKEITFRASNGDIACTYYFGASFTVSDGKACADNYILKCKYENSTYAPIIKDVMLGKNTDGSLSSNCVLYTLQYKKDSSTYVTTHIIVACLTSGTVSVVNLG